MTPSVSNGRTLVVFLGSNIGNFDPPGADAFLFGVKCRNHFPCFVNKCLDWGLLAGLNTSLKKSKHRREISREIRTDSLLNRGYRRGSVSSYRYDTTPL